MNLLVLVGTTPFNQLIEAVDQQFSDSEFSITYQIASGSYEPSSGTFVRYTDYYQELIKAADIVISHGGAASVFELLEAGKKIVLVPNLSRKDQHQKDLAHFAERNQYCQVCWLLDGLTEAVDRCLRSRFKPYQREFFFMGRTLLQYFGIATP